MKYIFSGTVCIFFITVVFAQKHTKEIMRDGNAMVQAFGAGNYDKLLDYTYPGIFEVYGDRESFKELIELTMNGFKEQGLKIDSVYVQNPGAEFTAGTQLHSTLTQFLTLTFDGGYVKTESTLLAVSENKGKDWTFIDVQQLLPEIKAILFPDFNEALVFPEVKQPELFFDEQ